MDKQLTCSTFLANRNGCDYTATLYKAPLKLNRYDNLYKIVIGSIGNADVDPHIFDTKVFATSTDKLAKEHYAKLVRENFSIEAKLSKAE